MIIVSSGVQGLSEKNLAAAMKASGLPGVLLMQQVVNSGRYNREIDAIYIHPRGILTIEAKHSKGSGKVEPFSGLWRVGGKDDPTLGDPWYQAGQQSRVLASALADLGVGRVRGVVVISGDKIKMEVVELNPDLRGGHVAKLKELIEASLGESVSYGVAQVLAIRDKLNLNPSLVTQAAVTKEWRVAVGRGMEVKLAAMTLATNDGAERFIKLLLAELGNPDSTVSRRVKELYRSSVAGEVVVSAGRAVAVKKSVAVKAGNKETAGGRGSASRKKKAASGSVGKKVVGDGKRGGGKR